jgi:hypothetical protein
LELVDPLFALVVDPLAFEVVLLDVAVTLLELVEPLFVLVEAPFAFEVVLLGMDFFKVVRIDVLVVILDLVVFVVVTLFALVVCLVVGRLVLLLASMPQIWYMMTIVNKMANIVNFMIQTVLLLEEYLIVKIFMFRKLNATSFYSNKEIQF